MRTFVNIYPRYTQNICVRKSLNACIHDIFIEFKKKTLGVLVGFSKGHSDVAISNNVYANVFGVNMFDEAATVSGVPEKTPNKIRLCSPRQPVLASAAIPQKVKQLFMVQQDDNLPKVKSLSA